MPHTRSSLLWGVAAAGLYGLSAAPGVVWADSAKLTLYALHAYLPSLNPGDHAGWVLLAQGWLGLTWFWSPTYSLHLLSAVAGAVVVAGVHRLLLRWGDPLESAHGAAAVLLVAHPLWWAAAVAESYTPALALVVVGALLLSRGTTPAVGMSGVCAGLAVAAHAFAAVLVLPLAPTGRPRTWLPFAAGLVVGSAPMWLAWIANPPDPLTGFSAGGGGSWSWVVRAFLSPDRWVRGVALVAGAMGFALGPIAIIAIVRRIRRGGFSRHPNPILAAVSLSALAALLTVYSPYRLHLMVSFVVVGAVLLAPPAASLRWCIAHGVLQVALYGAAAGGAHLVGRESLGVRQLPGRDNATYFLLPPKSWEHSAEAYARRLLAAVPENAVVLADFNPGAVLRLVQELEGVRPDVTIIPTAVDDALATPDPSGVLAGRIGEARAGGRPVVLADSWPPYYRVEELRRLGYSFAPCGPGLLVERAPDR